jgi:hypothetical protein
MTTTTNPALESEALYTKSKVYISRGIRAHAAGDNEEYQLWASLAVELLGKAALSKCHPALVADPTHYQSLFAACGRPLSPDVKTITAKTLFERLGHLDRAFDSRHQRFCEQMALRRNSELHSGESPFSGMSAEAWETEYWGAVDVILKMQGQNLDSWLGAEAAKAPSEIVKKAQDATERAVKNRIAGCKADFETKYGGEKKRQAAREAAADYKWWEKPTRLETDPDAVQRHACPSCGGSGLLAGFSWHEEVSNEEDLDDPYIEFVDTHYGVDEFFCPTCDLHLVGAQEITAANLPDVFIETRERERKFEEEYMNE